MINVVTWIAIFIASCSEIYVWSDFYDSKINFKRIYLYIALILMMVFGMFNYFYVNAFIRFIIVVFLLSFCNWLIFGKKLNETVVSTIFGQLILILAEIILTILLVFVFGEDTTLIANNVFGSFLGNVLISTMFVIISSFSMVKKLYCRLIELTNNIHIKNLMRLCLLIIISVNVLMALIYYEMNSIYAIIINTLLLLIYSFIVYKTINEKNNSLMVKAENHSLMESLNEYENMLDRQRVDNHENKNQLLIIKNMIKKEDKDVINYIDTIVKDQKEDDEILYTKVKKVPSGGLQGIIYQKMLVMKDKDIVFNIDVSRDIRKIDLDNFSMDNNYKLCKIIGVLLDNAIEESVKLKDKLIMISLYEDDGKLIIEVSNKFDGDIDLDLINNEGFTTKGGGHGYGLSLVKKIVSESEIFVNERQINNNIFKQIIKVKIK